MANTLLRFPAVLSRVPASRSTLYNWIAKGEFPRPIRLGSGRTVAFLESDVDEWIESRVEQARQAAAG